MNVSLDISYSTDTSLDKKESEKNGACTEHVQTLSLSIFFDRFIHVCDKF